MFHDPLTIISNEATFLQDLPAFASEYLANLEEMFPQHYMHSDVCINTMMGYPYPGDVQVKDIIYSRTIPFLETLASGMYELIKILTTDDN